MKKHVFLPALLLILCFAFVSCDPSPGGGSVPSDPIKDSIIEDLSKLESGSKIEIGGIGPETAINLSDFSLGDRIYIEVQQKDKGFSKNIISDSLFEREDGTLIPIPGQNGNVELTGSDLGIESNGTIIIRHFPMDNDFEIRKGEDAYKDKTNILAEELYYVDFIDDNSPFKDLKKDEIVLVKTGLVGIQGFTVLQQNIQNKNAEDLLDLSSYDGFAINMFFEFGTNEKEKDAMILHVLNPIHASTTPTELPSFVNVIMVDKQDETTNYKVVVSYDGDDAAQVIHAIASDYGALQLNPRKINGQNRLPCVYPEFDAEKGTITYHLGKVTEPVLFNLDYSIVTDIAKGIAKVQLAEDNEGITVYDSDFLSNLTSKTISVKAGEILTWAYDTDIKHIFEIEAKGSVNRFSVDHEYGRGSGFGEVEELYGSGFFLLDNPGNEALDMLKLTKTEYKKIGCRVIRWNEQTNDYVCVTENCEYCAEHGGSPTHYSTQFILDNRAEVFMQEGEYRANDNNNYGIYGNIGSLHLIAWCSNMHSLGMKNSTTGSDGGPIRAHRWNLDNSSVSIVLQYTEFRTDENDTVSEMVCNVWLNGKLEGETPDFTNVELTFVPWPPEE